MIDNEQIDRLAKIYDSVESQYEKYVKHFDDIHLEESELIEFPTDLAKVIKGTLGTQRFEWIQKKIPALNGQRVVDLIKTENGLKAVKLILFRMP